MGSTISDINKVIYDKWRKQGFSHEEAIQKVPEKMREKFVKDISMSNIESHFGIKDNWFYSIIVLIVLISSILLMII